MKCLYILILLIVCFDQVVCIYTLLLLLFFPFYMYTFLFKMSANNEFFSHYYVFSDVR